jgi:hypothetical protein
LTVSPLSPAAEPVTHCTGIHFPNPMTWTFAGAPAADVSSTVQNSQTTTLFRDILSRKVLVPTTRMQRE